jgi:hypothetical protein
MMRRTRIFAAAAIIGLVMATGPGATAGQGRFEDDDGSVHQVAIETLADSGITSGCNPPDNNRFCPDDPVTRGQMAAFLRRGIGGAAPPTPAFTDTGGSVFEDDIAWLAGRAITSGCNPPDSNRFCPDDPVTRGQMAAFLVRAFGYTGGSGDDRFDDDDNSVFEDDIDRLADAGVTIGCNPPDNDLFCPDDPVTRGAMATFLVRALGLEVAPTALPLLQAEDITHLGAFALPRGDFGGSRFGYGGGAVAPHHEAAATTLFMRGHAQEPEQIAQIRVPDQLGSGATLPLATVLQPFADITDGNLPDGSLVYGLLPDDSDLIVAASEFYDADGSQRVSHGRSSMNLSSAGDFTGFVGFDSVAPSRSVGGYMTPVPVEWQAALGGTALTGQCCLSIISNTSSGPSVTVFDPTDVGTATEVPGDTLIWYPLSDPLAPETTQNDLFNLATVIPGVAFPPGTRSILFIGRQGTGPYCYGPGTSDPDLHGLPTGDGTDTWCYDPTDDSKGTHAYPYRHQMWAYDAAELLDVRSGALEPWEVRPYAVWELEGMTADGDATIVGAGFDPIERRLYVTENYGEDPHVHVFQVGT